MDEQLEHEDRSGPAGETFNISSTIPAVVPTDDKRSTANMSETKVTVTKTEVIQETTGTPVASDEPKHIAHETTSSNAANITECRASELLQRKTVTRYLSQTPSPTRRPRTPDMARKSYDTSPSKSSTSTETSPERQRIIMAISGPRTSNATAQKKKLAKVRPTPTVNKSAAKTKGTTSGKRSVQAREAKPKSTSAVGVKAFINKLSQRNPNKKAPANSSGSALTSSRTPLSSHPSDADESATDTEATDRSKQPVDSSGEKPKAAPKVKDTLKYVNQGKLIPARRKMPSPMINSKSGPRPAPPVTVNSAPAPASKKATRLRQQFKSPSASVPMKPASRLVSPVSTRKPKVQTQAARVVAANPAQQRKSSNFPHGKRARDKNRTVERNPKPSKPRGNISADDSTKQQSTVNPNSSENEISDERNDNDTNNLKVTVTAASVGDVCPEAMKETNLSDNIVVTESDAESPNPVSTPTNANLSPAQRTGVQLNRAARLRLLKQNKKIPNPSPPVFV